MTGTIPRFESRYVPETGRRIVAGKDVIIHCHHYNSRIQRTIEEAAAIDGKRIFVTSAEAVFAEQIANAVADLGTGEGWGTAAALYSHLGFGSLDVGSIDSGTVVAEHSHFVEGWNAGFPARRSKVCSLTEGYLQAAFSSLHGELVWVHEVECMVQGAPVCRFEVERGRTTPLFENHKPHPTPPRGAAIQSGVTGNVDEATIIDVLVAMPISGGNNGLIPKFNVYLATVPADFYNLVSLRFVEEMSKVRLGDVARSLLKQDAETCGLNTFRGIMGSPEWDALIAPMIHSPEDALHGIIAVSNALGWGSWRVQELEPARHLRVTTANGYEADGTVEYHGTSSQPNCLMLSGVAAGIMELVYGEGSLEDRFGQFVSREEECRSCGHSHCSFEVDVVE